jgi:hypothetical protein
MPAQSQPEVRSLDDLVTAIRDMMEKRYPDADWAALTIHHPGPLDTPSTTLLIRPRTQPLAS